jgi:hypothetical protein
MKLIKSTTISTNQSSINITDLGSYKDLVIHVKSRTTLSSNESLLLGFNNDANNNYGWVRQYGIEGSGVENSDYLANTRSCVWGLMCDGRDNSSEWSATEITVLDYKNTNKFKNTLWHHVKNGSGSIFVTYVGYGHWKNTSPITTLNFFGEFGNNFQAGTRIDVYGIGAA